MPKETGILEIIPEGFDRLAERYKGSRELILATLNATLRDIGKALVPAVKAETPVGATRKLRNYTVFQIIGQAEDMQLEIRQSAFSDRGYPYGRAVRGGTRPHFPPYRALIPWVNAKLHISGKDAPRVAFLVARKISRVGTRPNPYHERAYQSCVGQIGQIISARGQALEDRLGAA